MKIRTIILAFTFCIGAIQFMNVANAGIGLAVALDDESSAVTWRVTWVEGQSLKAGREAKSDLSKYLRRNPQH